jgi:hypothetical protein
MLAEPQELSRQLAAGVCLRLDAAARLTHLARETHLPRCAAAAPAPPLAATRGSEGEGEGEGEGKGEGKRGEGGRAAATGAARRAVAARLTAQLGAQAAVHAGGEASLEAMVREAVREAARQAVGMAEEAVVLGRCSSGRGTLRMRGLADLADLAGLPGACEPEGGGAEMARDVEEMTRYVEGEERCFAAAFQLLLRRAAQETLALLPLPGRAIA